MEVLLLLMGFAVGLVAGLLWRKPVEAGSQVNMNFRFGPAEGKEVVMALLKLTADEVDALVDKQIPFSINPKDLADRPAKIHPEESTWTFADNGTGGSAVFADDKMSGYVQLPFDPATGKAILTEGFVAGDIDLDLDTGENKMVSVRGDYSVTTEGAVVEFLFGTPH